MNNSQENLMSVADYAREHNVSVQAVYKRLRSKSGKEFLDGHIYEISSTKYLDSYAVNWLETNGRGQNLIISSINDELTKKMNKINELNEKLIATYEERDELKDSCLFLSQQLDETKNKLLLAEKSQAQLEAEKQAEREQLEREIAELKEQLEAEQNRKLTFGERFLGKKKHRD